MKLALFLLMCSLSFALCLEEDEDCVLPRGEKGKCIQVNSCTYARTLLQNKQYPTVCGFNGNNPLVCCPENEPEALRRPGNISDQHCLEYYPSVYRVFYITPGAKPSLAKEFPHMAAIGFGEANDIKWLCGGSLISYNFILTAAHCLTSRNYGPPRYVLLGDLDLAIDTDEASPQTYNVKRVIPYPQYNRPARYHDIGLIELDKNVTRGEYVQIACLDTSRNHNETQMTGTGWGRTAFSGEFSTHLLKANLDIVPYETCAPMYSTLDSKALPYGLVDDAQICAGGSVDQDSCEGDSGGPLQVVNTDRAKFQYNVFNIVGITSFGRACGLSRTPGIYTRVYNYLIWIEDIVWPPSQ